MYIGGQMHFEIDDAVFRDTRFMKLVAKVGDHEKAMGIMLSAWMAAFEFWKEKHPVPRSTWVERGLSDVLIEVGLARYHGDDGVYVSGTERMCSWYHKAKEKGKKGGLKSQENRRSTARLKSTQAKPNQPTIPIPIPIPIPVPNTFPRTGEGHANPSDSTQAAMPVLEEKPAKKLNAVDSKQRLVAWWCQEYKRRYGVQYRVTGKDIGILKRLREGLGSDAVFDRVVTAYLDMPDQWFVNKRHDVATLEANLAKVSQFEQSGKMITQGELRNLDKRATNQALMEKVKRGEI